MVVSRVWEEGEIGINGLKGKRFYPGVMGNFWNQIEVVVAQHCECTVLNATELFTLFLTSLLEYNCFTMLCQFLLYNKVNQLYVYIYLHIPPSCVSLPPSLYHPSRWSQSTELISLCYAAASHQLSIYFTFGSVYMSMPLSHFVPAYLSPSPCPQVHSLCLCLYSCPAPRFFRTIKNFFFRFHIYVLAYSICFSLSDLLHSV